MESNELSVGAVVKMFAVTLLVAIVFGAFCWLYYMMVSKYPDLNFVESIPQEWSRFFFKFVSGLYVVGPILVFILVLNPSVQWAFKGHEIAHNVLALSIHIVSLFMVVLTWYSLSKVGWALGAILRGVFHTFYWLIVPCSFLYNDFLSDSKEKESEKAAVNSASLEGDEKEDQ